MSGAIAVQLGAGVVLIRKPGKLPAEKIEQSYGLEYGTILLCGMTVVPQLFNLVQISLFIECHY